MSNRPISLIALVAMIALGASQLGASCGTDSKTPEPSAEAPTPEAKPAAAAAPAPVAPDVYPAIREMAILADDQRREVAAIAKAELCPCPDSQQSLHDCMGDPKKGCNAAIGATYTIMSGVNDKKTRTDIQAEVAEYVANLKKSYEFTLEGVPVRGNPEASVKLVEFADFQCPHCKQVVPIMRQVSEKYGDQIAFYFKQYPLPGHPLAPAASAAALAAHAQGKFWPMHDLIFENQDALSPARLKQFAEQIGLNRAKLESAMGSKEIQDAIERDIAEANRANLEATPTLFINGKRYLGEKSVEAISAAIDLALADAEAG